MRLLALVWCLLMTVAGLANDADSIFVGQTLRQAPQGAGTLYFARQFLGRPYVAHTLEADDEEHLVVNTRQLDCTTLVENVVALTLCHAHGEQSFACFCRYLRMLRYRGGTIEGYPSRLHYFTDWINDNVSMGLVEEVSGQKPPFTAVQVLHVNYMSRHPQSYKALRLHPQFLETIARQERLLTGGRYYYIPKTEVLDSPLLRQVIRDGDILAITCSKPGLDIAHLGFAVWKDDGLHLLNASQLHKKVVEEPMTMQRYLQKHPSFTGIRVVRLR